MIPLIKKLAKALLYDELTFVRWARGIAIGMSAGGVAFADQLAEAIGAPGAVKTIKITAAICGLAGGMITAGQKNATEDQKQ
ncbi:MAG: hypothetical protein QXN55_08780 [Candidatus Nitrosotenuis sp.]